MFDDDDDVMSCVVQCL